MKNGLFDLDGTLVDSLPGIKSSTRIAIAQVLPEVGMPDLRAMIGPPIATMFARAWPDLEPEKLACLLAAFRSHYFEEGCLESRPFPGVPETLLRVHAAGVRLFVLTNKPAAPAQKILDTLGLAQFFTTVMAPDSVKPPLRLKPEGALLLMEKFGLKPGETTLVGDGADDAASADACGFRFIAAAYGYGTAAASAKLRIEKFSEIERLLL